MKIFKIFIILRKIKVGKVVLIYTFTFYFRFPTDGKLGGYVLNNIYLPSKDFPAIYMMADNYYEAHEPEREESRYAGCDIYPVIGNLLASQGYHQEGLELLRRGHKKSPDCLVYTKL